jgi:hypothetical protein
MSNCVILVDNSQALDFYNQANFAALLATLANNQKILKAFFIDKTTVVTEAVVQIAEIICTQETSGILTIVSEDQDFLPLVQLAHRHRWLVEMCTFSNAYNPHGEMALIVDRIRALDAYLDEISAT